MSGHEDESDSVSPVVAALHAFVSAETWDDTRAVVEAQAALLLTEGAEETLRKAAGQASDRKEVQRLTVHADLLRDCRVRGIPESFERLKRGLAEATRTDALEELALMLAKHSPNWTTLASIERDHPGLLADPHLTDRLAVMATNIAQHREFLADVAARGVFQALADRGVGSDERLSDRETVHLLQHLINLGNENRPETIEERIALASKLIHILSNRSKVQATALFFLGNALTSRAERGAGQPARDDLDAAIVAYRTALDVCTLEADPDDHATVQHDLGTALMRRAERSAGQPARDDLDAAIVAHRAALAVWTLETNPSRYAMVQHALGKALVRGAERSVGQPARDDLDAAIVAYRAALAVWTLEVDPNGHAMVQHSLGNALRMRAERSAGQPARDDLDAAIVAHRAALAVCTVETGPDRYAWIHYDLGSAFVGRAERGAGQAARDDLDAAIVAFNTALAVWTLEVDPDDHALVQHGLGNALASRAERGAGQPARDDLDAAIVAYRAALAVWTLEINPNGHAMVQHGLGNALVRRAGRSAGQAAHDDLDAAIFAHRAALAVWTLETDPHRHAMVQHGLGNALMSRAERSAGQAARDNHDAAVVAFNTALALWTLETEPYRYAMVQHALGTALVSRAEQDVGQAACDDLDAAVVAYRAALAVWTLETEPNNHAMVQHGLGNAFVGRAERSAGQAARDDLDAAIVAFNTALAVWTPQTNDESWLQTSRALVNALLLQGNWGNAAYILENVLNESIIQIIATADAIRRSEILDAVAGCGDELALCFIHLERHIEAFAALARGRSIQRSIEYALDRLARDGKMDVNINQARSLYVETRFAVEQAQANLTEHTRASGVGSLEHAAEHRRLAAAERSACDENKAAYENLIALLNKEGLAQGPPPPSLSALASAVPPGGVLAMLLAGSTQGAVLIVPHSASRFEPAFQVLHLPALSRKAIIELHVAQPGSPPGWLEGYAAFSEVLESCRKETPQFWNGVSAWNGVIEDKLEALWSLVMGPLHEHLERNRVVLGLALDSDDPPDVVLLVPGRLAPLPLHVARRRSDGGAGWRTFLEDWTVSFAESPQALIDTAARLVEPVRAGRSLLAISDPLGDLRLKYDPGWRNPALAIEDAFAPGGIELRGAMATSAAVLKALPDRAYISFFSHGVWDVQDPGGSGLVMADGRLTLRDLRRGLNLSASRLAILAACETGTIDLKHADEFIGLAAGLVAAGVPGVVASLWPVPVVETEALVRGLLSLHLRTGLRPAAALRRVQLALMQGGVEAARAIEPLKLAGGDVITVAPEFPLTHIRGPNERTLTPMAFGYGDDDDELPSAVALPPSAPLLWAGFILIGA